MVSNKEDLIQQKDREILSLQIKLIEFKKLLENVEALVLNIKCSDHHAIHHICRLIKESTRTFNKQDEDFWKHFITLYPNYQNFLLQKSSKLTPDNLLICAYMKIGYSNKQIAHRLGIQHSSVLQNQSRIKKKMGLPKEQTLRDFINGL